MIRACWAIKWNIARLIVAGTLLFLLASDHSSRLARLQLAALPDFDFASEVRALRLQGRHAEALSIADAGLASLAASPNAGASAIRELQAEKAATADEHSGVRRRLGDAAMGAISGTGDSLEGLLGAITADMLVVGDVRDLVIQAGKLAIDGEADPVIAGLSGVGLATTVAPQVDWGPSLLKIARKLGAMSDRLGDSLVGLARAGRHREVLAVADDVGTIAKATSPATAVRILKHIDDPAEIATIGKFVQRTGPQGVLVLHAGGKQSVKLIANLTEAGADAEAVAMKAAAKGPSGIRWLQTPLARTLFKPHLIVGIVKGLYKGTLPMAMERAIQRLDPYVWIALPAVAVWTLMEAALLVSRWSKARRVPVAAAPA